MSNIAEAPVKGTNYVIVVRTDDEGYVTEIHATGRVDVFDRYRALVAESFTNTEHDARTRANNAYKALRNGAVITGNRNVDWKLFH